MPYRIPDHGGYGDPVRPTSRLPLLNAYMRGGRDMYMYIERTPYGYRISTSGTPKIHYIGYSMAEAEKQHRREFELKHKRLTKIIL